MTAGRTRIKICGLSRMEDISYVNEALPDYCGFVIGVPTSRRNVTVEQLVSLKERLSDRICPVGVFVNADQELVAELLNGGVIDIAQLRSQSAALFRATAPSQGRRPCSGSSSPAWAHRARNTSAVSSSTSSRVPRPASTRTTTALT